MQITPEVKSVLQFVSQDETRFALKHVLAEPDGRFVATNGHYLVVLTTPQTAEAPDWVEAPHDIDVTAPMLLNASDLAKLLRDIPKQKSLHTSWKRAYLTSGNGQGLYFVTRTREATRLSTVQCHDGQFPQYQRVIPAGEPRATVYVNPKYLKDICQAAMDLGATALQLDMMPGLHEHKIATVVAHAQGHEHRLLMVLMQLDMHGETVFDHEVDADTASMMLATCGGY